MSNFARIINGVAIDVSTDPENRFHPDIAKDFVPVPDQVEIGWSVSAGKWSPPAPVEPTTPAPVYPKVSPVEFKMLFTIMERVAIRTARATDPTVDDFFDLVEDPRLSYVDLALPSVQGALHYLAATQLITDARIPEILSGNVL